MRASQDLQAATNTPQLLRRWINLPPSRVDFIPGRIHHPRLALPHLLLCFVSSPVVSPFAHSQALSLTFRDARPASPLLFFTSLRYYGQFHQLSSVGLTFWIFSTVFAHAYGVTSGERSARSVRSRLGTRPHVAVQSGARTKTGRLLGKLDWKGDSRLRSITMAQCCKRV
jgi:hypothetical protein